MKIKKSDLLNMIQEQNDVIAKLIRQVNCHHEDIIRIEGVVEPEPQPKQLDQSVFKGSPDWAVSAAISPNGKAYVYSVTGYGFYGISDKYGYQVKGADRAKCIGGDYDTTDWQNSLIERDITKELTGSDLCRAMLERGDKYVMCLVSDSSQEDTLLDGYSAAISSMTYNECFYGYDFAWLYATPINNQGEPLTAAEAGL